MATWTNFMAVNARARKSAEVKRQASLGGGGGSNTFPQLFAQDRAVAAKGRADAISKFQEAMALLDTGAGEETGRKALAAAESNFIGRGLSSSSLPGAVSAGITADIEGQRKTQLSALLTQFAQLLANPGGPTTVTPGAVVSASSAVPRAGSVSTSRPRSTSLLSGTPAAATVAKPMPQSIFKTTGTGGRGIERFSSSSPTSIASGGPRFSFDFGQDIQTFPDFINDPLDLTGFNFG